MKLEIRDRLEGVDAEAWDALVGDGCPFFEHAFLLGLERTGCVGPGTGWDPRYVLLREGEGLLGALALYRKEDSYGEFIFDWSWAQAAAEAGLPYYPKMTAAAPFSPVGGPRFLVHPQADKKLVWEALLQGARRATMDEPATGLHMLFVAAEEAAFLEAQGLAIRHTHQFHWKNEGYRSFDDFLARFRSKRRNQIRRERRSVQEAGVEIRIIEGEAAAERADDMWGFYRSTVDKFYWGRRYLNRAFFDHLAEHFHDNLLLVIAERDGEVLAGTVNVRKGERLYGRYWGCSTEVRNLHFEVCSYAGIEACIDRGIRHFEAGAGGGGHKFGRGFLPVTTYSAHEIYLPPLDEAVRRALRNERAHLAQDLARAQGKVLKPE